MFKLSTRLAVAGVVPALLGLAAWVGAAPAGASTTGCAFTNGCATLNGVDAASHLVAMDAKHQSSKTGTLIIGYPNLPGDGATNFAADLHFTRGAKTVTYTDTALQITPLTFHNTCGMEPLPLTPAGGVLTATGTDTLSVQTGVTGITAVPSVGDTVLTFTGTNTTANPATLVVDENFGAGCVVALSWPVPSGAVVPSIASVRDYAPNGVTFPVDGIQFTNSSAETPVTFTYPNPVTGVVSNAAGLLSVSGSTAAPGTYSNVGVTSKDSFGAESTSAFALVVSAMKVVSPGNHVPFWTFIYAKNGVWSSQCVTDVGGSGALILAPCTLGRDLHQDFYALSGGTPSAGLPGGGQFDMQNRFAALLGPASCLTDPSSLDPSVPQSNAADQAGAPTFGRQLRVDGSCTAVQNLWRWAT